MYKPDPIDTSGVELGDELLRLTEQLAENVHDVWAENRIKEGWRLGYTRDDKTRRTPCLVPYSELPEDEKEYDRNTALATVKAIIALGFRIEKN